MTAKILSFSRSGKSASDRHITEERQACTRLLPDEISEAVLEESRQRAREMVFTAIVFAFAIIGAAWSLGYAVGTVSAWWAA